VPNPPLPAPVEKFGSLIRWLSHAVITRTHFGLPQSLIGPLIDRLRGINQYLKRIADRVRDGKYAPRRSIPRQPPAERRPQPRPRPPDKLPRKFGWLLPLVPEAAVFRSQLEHLLRDPEFSALIAAAPATLGRPLRSLCWMLWVRPPDILAPAKRPRPPRPPRPAKAAKPPPLPPIGPPPTPPDAPAWMHMPPSRTRWPPSRTRAPKNRV
jgi:hypothetical protein